jgi:hypothetical protein
VLKPFLASRHCANSEPLDATLPNEKRGTLQSSAPLMIRPFSNDDYSRGFRRLRPMRVPFLAALR